VQQGSSDYSRQEKRRDNQQQAQENKTARSNSVSTLQQNKNTHTADRPTLTSSETQDAFTLTDKIKYLKSKNLLNDSRKIEAEIFPQ